jgi:hypothetical protein
MARDRDLSLRGELQAADQIAELQRALKRALTGEAKAKARNAEIAQAIYDAAYQAAIAGGRATPVKRPPEEKRKTKPEVALVHSTDWQLGKATKDYNVEVCERRIEQLVYKVLDLTQIQRRHHPVNECVLMLGGDHVEGIDIFKGQAWEIEAHLFEQLFGAARIMETMIRNLAGCFNTVRVVCEYGNHGRMPGGYGTNPAGDNFDRMAFKITQDRTTDLEHVTWQSSDDWYQHFTIGNYKVLLVHGDEIRTYSGTPLFAIGRRVSAWAAGVVPQFNDCYMGHWHNPMSLTLANGQRCFITGSPESSNLFAEVSLAAKSVPSQRLHFVDPDKGRVTAEYVIWLD